MNIEDYGLWIKIKLPNLGYMPYTKDNLKLIMKSLISESETYPQPRPPKLFRRFLVADNSVHRFYVNLNLYTNRILFMNDEYYIFDRDLHLKTTSFCENYANDLGYNTKVIDL